MMPLSRQPTQGHLRLARNNGVVSLLLRIHWNSPKSSLQSGRAHAFRIARGLFLGRHVLMKRVNGCLYG